jgi:hypothetical protein
MGCPCRNSRTSSTKLERVYAHVILQRSTAVVFVHQCPVDPVPYSEYGSHDAFATCHAFALSSLSAHHGQHRDVQASTLAADCQDCELNANALGQAAGPHLKAGVGVASFDGPADGVVPNVHDAIPADKYPIK